MRKEIQDHPGCDAELLTEQKRVGVLVQAFTVHHNDQLIHTSAFQEVTNFVMAEDADEFQAPNVMPLDGSSKLMGRGGIAYHRNVTHIQRAVFGYFHQNDSIRNKKDVVDDQHQQNHDSVRGIRIDKRNQNSHQEPRKTYRLGKPADLSQWRQRGLGIDLE